MFYLENEASAQRLTYAPSQLSKKANGKVNLREIAVAANKLVGNWKHFASTLAPAMFRLSAIDKIASDRQVPFDQAYDMLTQWTNKAKQGATCHLMITTFLAMSMKADACEIFGDDLVEFVATARSAASCKFNVV